MAITQIVMKDFISFLNLLVRSMFFYQGPRSSLVWFETREDEEEGPSSYSKMFESKLAYSSFLLCWLCSILWVHVLLAKKNHEWVKGQISTNLFFLQHRTTFLKRKEEKNAAALPFFFRVKIMYSHCVYSVWFLKNI